MTARRWPALVLISGMLVAAGIADRGHAGRQASSRAEHGGPTGQLLGGATAVAAPIGALSSTWFCAGATATEGGSADGVVAIANPGPRDLPVVVTVFPVDGRPRTRPVVAPARDRVRVLLRGVVSTPFAAASVEVRGGGVSVDQEVSGPDGYEASPCASTSSDHWYFAAGGTQRGADEYLALFNPYPDDTSVDLTFATEDGPRSPRPLQAFPVPGLSLRVVHLNAERVNRHTLLAAQVVARSGRLVVGRLEVFSGRGGVGPSTDASSTAPPRGVAVSTGVAAPATSWAFPSGRKVRGSREQVVVSNPSDHDASVDIAVTLDEPLRNGVLDPFPLSVPAHDAKAFDLTDQNTLPDNVDHSFTVSSTNGVAVVAEQIMTGGPPWRVGATITPGSPLEARSWLFAGGGLTRDTSEQLVVQNLSGERVHVDVDVLGGRTAASPTLRGVAVAGRGRVTIRLDPLERSTPPLEVRASGPVVVARGVYRTGAPGISLALGVPRPAGAQILPP